MKELTGMVVCKMYEVLKVKRAGRCASHPYTLYKNWTPWLNHYKCQDCILQIILLYSAMKHTAKKRSVKSCKTVMAVAMLAALISTAAAPTAILCVGVCLPTV